MLKLKIIEINLIQRKFKEDPEWKVHISDSEIQMKIESKFS